MEKKDCGVLIFVLCLASLNSICCRPVPQQLQVDSQGREPALPTEKKIFYEDGFQVQTILDGHKINVSIYRTSSVPGENYIFAVDMHTSQILKLKLPIDQNTEIVRVAGSEDGKAGHKDGWGKASLFNHPKDLTVDDEGNIYVADVRDGAIRKINHEGVVSTIAGESNVSGFADGEGRKARFSADFDVTYISSICSLLVSDRGNNRLRLIQLKNPEVCKPGISSRGFSVGLEGLVFVVSGTIVMSTITVLAFKNVNLREKVAQLQTVAHRLMWRRDNDLYTPLQNSGLPQFLPDGMRPPIRTSSLPSNFPERLPDLIDLSYETSTADEARHAPPITQNAHYNRGAYPREDSGSFPHTLNAPRHSPIAEGAHNSRAAEDPPENLRPLIHTQSAPGSLISELDSARDTQI